MKQCAAVIIASFLLTLSYGVCRAGMVTPAALSALDSSVDVVVLSPGDSRSLEFEYNGTFGEPGSFHFALVTAMLPDEEIRQLTVTITPTGEVGSAIGYFTWGIFANLTSAGNMFETLEPKFTYGFKHVSYSMDVNPTTTTGFVFSTALVEYEHFDFPLEMSMILTLSN